ncbi:MAG: hypothetical protein PHD45_10070 [Bacteroidales bacterium]|nr:hypothetical protein [Bacteroidales bacterium]
MDLEIFYSWQSKITPTKNRYYIKKCLKKAISKIEEQKKYPELNGVNLILEEGVSGLPGSPPVASTIVDDRIPNCAIFIADLSVTDPLKDYEIKKKHKRGVHQALNVIFEYGVAYNAISSARIIGILNSEHGSPNDNNENIPFDIRHLRYGIEYRYKEKEIEFINALADAISLCAIEAIKQRRNKFKPFISWYEHSSHSYNKSVFYENERINQIKEILKNNIDNIRFLGLSGLGKTRITFEAFRNKDNNESINYLYVDYNLTDISHLREKINDIFLNVNNSQTLVVDNCPIDFYREIIRSKHSSQASNPIITLYNEPKEEEYDKINNVNYINLEIGDLTSVVDDILKNNFSNIKDEYKATIKEFSEGLPLMAVLMAESLAEGNVNIGKLTDKELLNKLLGVNSDDEKEILKSCSIFKYIGYEGDFENQINFILDNKNISPGITGDIDKKLNLFYNIFNKYERRQIFEINGRLFGIRPRPLAFYLAEEWFSTCTANRMTGLINDISDNKLLVDSVCDQIKYMGYSRKASILYDKLLSINGSFCKAEVVNTEVGSRFFRSFVEVNPIAVADNLYRNFGLMTKEQLLEIDKGRRNLVWVLEKLCFDKRTFEKGAKLIMDFAAAENETWGNNATNEFLRLFKIQLPGTESSLEDRLEIIKWGLSKDNEHKLLSLKAIDSGLESQFFNYFSGAENQGTKKLNHYTPTYPEIYQYWGEMLKIIENEIDNKTDYADFCYKIIEKKARGICSFNKAIDVIFPYLEQFAEKKGYDWDGLLEILYHIKNYDFKRIDSIYHERVNKLIESLTRNDFVSRFNEVSKFFRRGEQSIPFEEQLNIKTQKYKELAQEFIKDYFCSYEIIEALFLNKEIHPNSFGFTISELLKDDLSKNKLFIDTSVEIIKQYQEHEYDKSIIIDYTRGVDYENFQYLIDSLSEKEIYYLIFPLYGIKNIDLDYVDYLFRLVDEKKVTPHRFIDFFNYYHPSKEIKINFSKFFSRLTNYGEDGIFTIITLTKNILFFSNKDENSISLGDIVEDIINKVDIQNLSKDKFEQYFELIDILLKQKKRNLLAQHINNQIIDFARDINNNFIGNYSIENILSILLKEYFDVIWKDLSEALVLEGKDYAIYYNLNYIIGSSIGNIRPIGILFLGDIDKIFEWCDKYPKVAPVRLASMVPIYENGNIHPIALRLIDNFGDNDEVLNVLHSNINTFGWIGSLIPLLEKKKKLFEDLVNHKIPRVSKWARENIDIVILELENEKRSEEERKFLYN